MRYLKAIVGTGWAVATSSAFVSPPCMLRLKPSSVSGKSPAAQVRNEQHQGTTASPSAVTATTTRPRARGLKPLGCTAQQEEFGSAAAAATATAVETVGDLRRVYETWRWRGHKINFRVDGPEDAPPILLIHGFGASVGHYRKNFPTLVGEGYRVYAIDLLGFGASDKPKDIEYSLELWQEMLTDFIAEKSGDEKEQWVVMGNSIGGLLTLMLTEHLQEERKVRGSVLFNTAGGLVSFRKSELPFYLQPIMWFFNNVVFGPYFGPKFFANFKTEENVRTVLKQVYYRDHAVDDHLVKLLIAPSDDEGACEVFLKVFRGPAGPTPSSLLQKIKDTKVLALWGEADPWTPLKTGLHSGVSLGQHLDTFELVVLPETGHCPHDESPHECHAVILPWLKTLP
ncbi:unnamed protein product [Pylaiella littoralis]